MRYRANGIVPPGESRGFTGQGPLCRAGTASASSCSGSLSPRLLVTRASPQPDRLSDTSCRATRLPRGWSHREPFEWAGESANEFVDSPSRAHFSWICEPSARSRAHPMRAASRTPSRKEDAFRCTRGAFLRRTPLRGVPFSTACHQPVEWSPRLFNLRAIPRTDGATGGAATRPSPRGWIDTLVVGQPFPEERMAERSAALPSNSTSRKVRGPMCRRTSDAFHRRVSRSTTPLARSDLERKPATDPETLPPRSGFRRSFAPPSRRRRS
jgi:hypothetical protein